MTIKVAVVGAGDIAVGQHLPALAANPRFEVAAVVDSNLGRADVAATEWSVPVACALLEQVPASGLDAVVVATPPHVTPELCVQALEAGCHVLCEKPLAATLAAADRVVEAAQRPGAPVLQVGFKNRFSPLVDTLLEWIAVERIGRPLVLRIGSFDEAFDPADKQHAERIFGFLRHGPPVVHEGAHGVDLMRWLLGTPQTVVAARAQTDERFPGENYDAALLRWADGSLAKLEVGWLFRGLWPDTTQVLGPNGSACLDRTAGRLTYVRGVESEVVPLDEDWQRVCFRRQLAAFGRAIASGRVEGADAVDGREVLRICLAIAEAAASGESVDLAGWRPEEAGTKR